MEDGCKGKKEALKTGWAFEASEIVEDDVAIKIHPFK
jgi:hypothetical protein